MYISLDSYVGTGKSSSLTPLLKSTFCPARAIYASK